MLRRAVLGFVVLSLSCVDNAPPAETPKPPPLVAGVCAKLEMPKPGDPPYSSAYPVAESTDACGVASNNLETSAKAALSALAQTGAPLPATAWDHGKPPARLDVVDKRLGLTEAERALLLTRGFVVLEKHRFSTYAEAYHEIFQSELPLWVSMDSIFHAVYRSNDKLLERLEAGQLRDKLNTTLEKLHCALGAQAKRYPYDAARDVDLYLTVARSLLAGSEVKSIFGVDAEAHALFEKAQKAAGIDENVTIFGRSRVVDFSVYAPRGHYTSSDLGGYFRAATWLSRLEFNLATRDCASSSKGLRDETPREALAALSLSDLVTTAKAEADLELLETAWSTLAGAREDVSFLKLGKLARELKVDLGASNAFQQLRDAIGDKFPRTARTHFTWEGCKDLPVISTMLGPRIVPDASVTRPLVHSEIPGRQRLGVIEMTYAFGHNRAALLLAPEIAKFPTLGSAINKARKLAMAPLASEDLYSAWFGAIRALSDEPQGVVPAFMKKDPYRDLKIGSTVAAFGQLRHNYVLMAPQTYGEAGCRIPDAFVEPAPAVLDGLLAYAERGERVMKLLGKADDDAKYFARLGRELKLLKAITTRELENRPLPDDAQRFLSMVVESNWGDRGTGGAPSFTGWYFDMFASPDEAMDPVSFLTDFYTSTELNEATYAGVKGVHLGVFVVETGGNPRVVVGPVTDAFEAHEKLPRLTDAMVGKAKTEAPWARSYTAAPAAEPPLALAAKRIQKAGSTDTIVIEATSTKELGKVTIEVLDHHRKPIAAKTLVVGPKPVTFEFPGKKAGKKDAPELVQGIHVRFGEWHAWDTGEMSLLFGHAPLFAVDQIGRAWGGMTAPPSKHLERATGE